MLKKSAKTLFFTSLLLILFALGFRMNKINTNTTQTLAFNNQKPEPLICMASEEQNASTLPISIEPKEEPVVKTGFCLKVPVVLYHHIEPYELAKAEGHAQLTVDDKFFEQHIKYLVENGYSLISAEELVLALINKTQLPEKSIVVTLDDGYLDNYAYAFPIAKKYNAKINIMLSTGLVENKGYLTWGNVKEMSDTGIVYFYNHTWSHFSLPNGDKAKMEQEVSFAKKQLEDAGIRGNIFTYPYGAVNDTAIDVLKNNGYIGAFTTKSSFLQCDYDIFRLKRNHAGNAPLSSYGL